MRFSQNVGIYLNSEFLFDEYVIILNFQMIEANKYQQLLYKNRDLQKQLKEAHFIIKQLRQENIQLKQKLARYESQQSTTYIMGNKSDQEIFTQSSNSIDEDYQNDFQNLNQELSNAEEMEQNKSSALNKNSSISIMTPLSSQKVIEKTPPKVIFNYQSEGSHVPKVLVKQPKKEIRVLPQTLSNKQSSYSAENSAIKSEESILMRNTNPLFQRVKTSKKIYDAFFVTGYSIDQMIPIVQYYYPVQSKHFPAILSLIYTENSLRPMENINSGTKSPRVTNMRTGKLSIKDSFVTLLCKNQNGQKQYLFACEVQDLIEGPDKTQYIFPRLFCFITSCPFFSAYTKIIDQFINKINSSKQQFKICSPIFQRGAKEQLKGLLQEHLQILEEKNVEQNQYANFGLGNQINVFIDVPSASESFRNLLDYRPWGILFTPIHLINEVEPTKEKELFGFLLIYMLTQTKIMLYSMIKSKVSQVILHALQMIKPLEYVNPIIMATFKDEHQEYFDAPMSVLMGLWGEQKPKRKQKIEIFMHKKPSLNGVTGIIEQNKINTMDGVVFNLDTGITFGGGLTPEKNKIANHLNHLIQNNCKSTKQQYKLFQNLLKGKTQLQNLQMRELSQKILHAISGTQLYSVHRDKMNSMLKI